MAGGFFRKWFGGAPPVIPPEVEQALAELQKLAKNRSHLADPIQVLSAVVPHLYGAPIRTLVPSLTPDQARAKLTAGVPLLQGENFQIDQTAFQERWQQVCEALQKNHPDDLGRKLLDGLHQGKLDPGMLLSDVLAGRTDAIQQTVAALGLDAGLATIVVRLLLVPVLSPVNVGWEPLRQGVPWKKGYCPTCGNWPLLGEAPGQQQEVRHFRCSLCNAAWEVPAQLCPFCGEEDAHFLGSFTPDGGEPGFWAATCLACHGYVKMVATAASLNGPQLLIADLMSMDLDLAAAERGYAVPG
jgi:FdhE protein